MTKHCSLCFVPPPPFVSITVCLGFGCLALYFGKSNFNVCIFILQYGDKESQVDILYSVGVKSGGHSLCCVSKVLDIHNPPWLDQSHESKNMTIIDSSEKKI